MASNKGTYLVLQLKVMFYEVSRQALIFIGLASLIPLGGASIVGLIVSILQAATQIQEQTISFLIRILTVAAITFIFWHEGFSKLTLLTEESLNAIAFVNSNEAP